MKKTNQSANGTSFHGKTFGASVSDLLKILGEPAYEQNDGSDKINLEWEMETEAGDIFTVYDWKYYHPLSNDEIVEWHIGGHNERVTSEALNELEGALNNLG